MTVVVSSYADLIRDEFLNVERADAVARELVSGAGLVAYAPGWIVGEKDFPTSRYNEEVVAGSVENETEKAYLLSRDGHEAWFPKSVIRVYEAADDAEIVAPGTSGGESEGTA